MDLIRNIGLRIPREEDRQFIYRLFFNSDLSKFISLDYSYQRERLLNSILNFQNNQINFIVEVKNHTPVGLFLNFIEWKRQNVLCTVIFDEKNISFGGIAFESIGLILKFLKEEMNIRRIEFEISSENKKMLKLFRFLQYEQEKLKQNGLKGKLPEASKPELSRKDYFYRYGKFNALITCSFIIEDWKLPMEDVIRVMRGHSLIKHYG